MENFLSACHLLKMAVSPCVCCSAGNGYVSGMMRGNPRMT